MKFPKRLDPDLACLWEFIPEGDGKTNVTWSDEIERREYGGRPWLMRPVRQNGSRVHLRLVTAERVDARRPLDDAYDPGGYVERRVYASDLRRGVYWHRVNP